MNECFADSFYFFAMLNPRDEAHEITQGVHRSLVAPLVTTHWVLTEVADGFASTPSRTLFPVLLQRLHGDSRVTIIPSTNELFDEGVKMYEARQDKQWSLTDCISFIVMERRGIVDALTGDHHFIQAGFRALLMP